MYLSSMSFPVALLGCLLLFSCSNSSKSKPEAVQHLEENSRIDSAVRRSMQGLSFAANNGGISLPKAFKAVVVADELGRGRHLAVRENGDIFLKLRAKKKGHSLVALRDTTGDGQADVIRYFSDTEGGTGVSIQGDWLYHSSDEQVFRQRLAPNELLPNEETETVIAELPQQRQHAAKSLALNAKGDLFVNIGAPANACQEQMRSKGSPGQMPCPLLENHGGIWRFAANGENQKQAKDGERFVTGLRNIVALAWDANSEALYGVQHGRDQLHSFWPEYFSEKENAELPAEEFFRFDQGKDYGWPQCYYDPLQNKKVLAPEYGGDGKKEGDCDEVEQPLAAFPAHWAPNGLLFYKGKQFPERYQEGAFIAFHGSWNRGPLEQDGYCVVFLPMKDGKVKGEWEIFADDFAGTPGEAIYSPKDATYRPMGLAEGADGSLYISDSQKGRIWRIVHQKKAN